MVLLGINIHAYATITITNGSQGYFQYMKKAYFQGKKLLLKEICLRLVSGYALEGMRILALFQLFGTSSICVALISC